MQKISPYRYPLINSFLTAKTSMDLWDELSKNKPEHRTRLDPLIERIGPTVLNRVLPMLSLSINDQPIHTWAKLKELQKVHHMPLQVDHEDEDPWNIAGRPVELTMMLTIAFSAIPKAVDWNTLQSLYESLGASDRNDLAMLFDEYYGVDMNSLFDTSAYLWAEPEKVEDIPGSRDILGQQFVQIEDTKWKRVDRVVNAHKVYLVKAFNDYDEEDRSSRVCLEHVQVGCAATLEGAIEVAAKIVDQIPLTYRLDRDGFVERESADYRVLKICGQDGTTLLSAKLKEPDAPKLSTESTANLYDALWSFPYARNEVEEVKARIKDLYAEASEESRWDNFSTAQGLRKKAEAMERRLPSEKHDSYALQNTLRKIMARIGNDRQATALLGVDLGL